MVYVLLGLLAAFLAVILIRAALFRPRRQPETAAEAVEFDQDAPVEALAELIRCNRTEAVVISEILAPPAALR